MTIIRLSNPYCIIALLEAGCSILDIKMQLAIQFLLKSFSSGRIIYQDSDIATWSTRDGLLALNFIYRTITKEQIIHLFDLTIRLTKEKNDIIESYRNLQANFDESLVAEKKRLEELKNERINSFNRYLNFFRIATSILLLTVFFISIPILNNMSSLTKDQTFIIVGIILSLWGTITALIFTRKVY